MIEPEVLYDKLAGMKSVEEIREFCSEHSAIGYVGDATRCALAVLFRKETGWKFVQVYDHIEVAESWPHNWGNPDVPGWGEQFKLTWQMEAFIAEFDKEKFPELVLDIESYE